MKKAAAFLLAAILLAGCSGTSKGMERGISLRTKLLNASGCSFDAEISADYGDKLHSFAMQCRMDSDGAVEFTVTKPSSISGITGIIAGGDGKITYGDTMLHFPLLADHQLSPISAPWVLIKTLREGFLTSADSGSDNTRLTINDSYEDDALNLDVWLDKDGMPFQAEILYRQRKILSLKVQNFRIE